MSRKLHPGIDRQCSLFPPQDGGQCLTAGTDEAGRGCLAGPVTAAAVIFPDGFDLAGLDDSKVLSPEEREILAIDIKKFALGWGIGFSWMKEICSLNILQASLMAMVRALVSLRRRMGTQEKVPGIVLVDGPHTIPPVYYRKYGIPLPAQRAVVDGDALVPCISAASILAKTERDRLMEKLDARWPQYGFARHKGYGTKEHRQALSKYGPCPLHRMDFRSVLTEKETGQGRLI